MSDIGKGLVKEYRKEQGSRHNWEDLWQDAADFTSPNKDDIHNSDIRGEEKGQFLYDSTAIHATDLLSSVMVSVLTNPLVNWYALSVSGFLMRDPTVVKWLEDVADISHEVLNNSNFQVKNSEVFHDQIALGTAVLEVMEDDEDDVRFDVTPIYKNHIKENSKGVVDTIFREYKFTGRQIVQEFGEDALASEDMKSWREDPAKEMSIIHVVKPRKEINQDKKGPKNLPFASFHISLDVEGVVLKESGFHEFPYMVPRWFKLSGEKYGRGPAMQALAAEKMLNEMTKVDLQGYQLTVAPPMQAPDRSFMGPIRVTPYAMNYYKAGTDAEVKPLFTGVRIDLAEPKLQRMEDKINQHFFLDQLKLIRGPQMTATEAEIRNDENLRILSPILTRQEYEYLKPFANRVFGILFRKKRFPPVPEVLKGVKFQIRYTSLIAQAQRAAQAAKVGKYFNIVAPVIQIQPTVVDVIDGIEIMRDVALDIGLPSKYLKTPKEVEEIGKLRAQAEAKQAEQQSQMADSQIAKNVKQK